MILGRAFIAAAKVARHPGHEFLGIGSPQISQEFLGARPAQGGGFAAVMSDDDFSARPNDVLKTVCLPAHKFPLAARREGAGNVRGQEGRDIGKFVGAHAVAHPVVARLLHICIVG